MLDLKIKIIQNKINTVYEYFKNLIEKNQLNFRDGYNKEKVLSELNNIKNLIYNSNPITIAFVGEFNAGKTTIINILTDNNFPVSAKPETSKSIKIEWNNYTIIDTPGLGAGNPSHDKETEQWLASADLLIYILTPDLFNSYAGKRFHDILKKYNRDQELMLVMNMIDQEDNEIHIYEEELQSVIDPIPLNDYYPTFISAKYMLESINADDTEDKEYYREESRFDIFLQTLNAFLLNKEQKSRLTTPLTKLYALSQTFELKSEFNKEVEFLNLKTQFFSETLKTLKTSFVDFENNLKAEISATSGEIYSSLDNPPKKFKEFLENEFNSFNESLTKRRKDLIGNINLLMQDFKDENLTIEKSDLSKEVYDKKNNSEQLKDIFENCSNLNLGNNDTEKISFLNEIKYKFKDIEKIFDNNGGMEIISTAIKKGNFTELSSMLVKKIDKNLVLDIAHKFGHKFKPWGATKLTKGITKGITKAVPYLNFAVVVFEFASHIHKKNKEKKADKELREFKEEIKESLKNVVNETINITRKDIVNPLKINLSTLKKLHQSKKNELLEFSKTNLDLLKELETKRQLCLDVHEEIYADKKTK